MGSVGEYAAEEQRRGRVRVWEGVSWEEGRGGEEATSRGQGTPKDGIHHTLHGQKRLVPCSEVHSQGSAR